MSGTPLDVLDYARSQLGTHERADGGTPYHDELGYPHSWAWCCIFASCALLHGGVPWPTRGFSWVSAARDYLAAPDTPGSVLTGTDDARPGDLCFFEWGTTPGGYDHVGIVEYVTPKTLITIEGNTANAVQRHTRSRFAGGVRELGRPAYTTAPAPTPGEDDVKAFQVMIRDVREGRQGATYLTTVFDNGEGAVPREVGSGVGSLLENAEQVGKLQRSGIKLIDVGDDDPFALLSLGVLPCASEYEL